jgi:hypothetical protein
MRTLRVVATAAVTCVLCGGSARSDAAPARRVQPLIHIEDVALFYRVYDAAGGRPDAAQLQHDYLDRGSVGLHTFARLRNITGTAMAATLAKRPELYAGARRCMAALPAVRRRLQGALARLSRLYPAARFPPVTIAVSRGKPVGVADGSGVMIGLEALCATDWLSANVEDRFVHVIAHEYGHVEQLRAVADDENPSVLQASLVEGGAELVAELTSGEVGYAHLAALTRGRERDIEEQFVADEDKTDLSQWLYNSTYEKPGDLGYWVGYRIVKSYYQHAADKRRAFSEIMEMTDPKLLLATSGWFPGIELRRAEPEHPAGAAASRASRANGTH